MPIPHRWSLLSRITVAAVIASSAWLSTDTAQAADEKQVCLGAYISAQRLRQEDKLIEAREQLLLCARDLCPATLKKDCTTWTAEVDQATPSVVIDARNADGGDVIDVKVTVDGKPFAERIDGKARPLNPGVHTFHYETEGSPAVEEKVVIRAGDKMRKLTVKFAPQGKQSGVTPTPGPSADKPGHETSPDGDKDGSADKGTGSRPVPVVVYVLGGVGVAALAGFTYFAVKFNGQVSDLDSCKPRCSPDQVDDAKSTRTLSYIPLGIGVASLGAATILYLARPTVKPETSGYGPHLDVHQVAGGGLATFSTSF
jgi:hypothetical protein